MARQIGPQRDAELHVFYITGDRKQHSHIDLVEYVLAVPGVVQAEFNDESGRFIVLGNVTREVIEAQLRQAGIEPKQEETAQTPLNHRVRRKLVQRGKPALSIVMIVFLLSFLGGIVASLPSSWRMAGAVSTIVFVGVLFLVTRLLQPIKHKFFSKRIIMHRMEMSVLFFVTCMAAFASETWQMALIVVLCLLVSVAVPRWGFRRLYKRIGKPRNNWATVGHIVNEDDEQSTARMDVNRIAAGDTIQWSTGDVAAADGYVVRGQAKVHEQHVNGETIPFMCSEGQFLPAGSTIIEGTVFVRVTKTVENSMAWRIHRPDLLYALSNDISRRPFTRLLPHITTVLIYVALAFLIVPPFFLNESVGPWLTQATLILLVAPMHIVTTALYAAPLAAQTRISALGGAFRSFKAVSQLGRADNIVCSPSLLLDERHTISTVETFANVSLRDALYVAATAFAGMKTPFARALVRAAREQDVTWAQPTQRKEQVGYGIEANVLLHGRVRKVLVGNTRWLKQNNIRISHEHLVAEAARQSAYVVWLVIDNKLAAAFFVYARVRDGCRRFVQRLYRAGVRHITLLSTEELPYVQRLAEQAGIKQSFSLSPEQHAEKLGAWRSQGRTMASIGLYYDSHLIRDKRYVHVTLYEHDIDEQSENELTIRLVSSDTGKMFTLVTLARKMNRVAGRSLFFGCAVKTGLIVAAILGRPALWHVAVIEAFFVIAFVVYSTAILRHRR